MPMDGRVSGKERRLTKSRKSWNILVACVKCFHRYSEYETRRTGNALSSSPVVRAVCPVINFTHKCDTTRGQAALNGERREISIATNRTIARPGSNPANHRINCRYLPAIIRYTQVCILDTRSHVCMLYTKIHRYTREARTGTTRGSLVTLSRAINSSLSFFLHSESPWRSPIDLLTRDPSTFPSASISIYSTTTCVSKCRKSGVPSTRKKICEV